MSSCTFGRRSPSFNTQPPEGGWPSAHHATSGKRRFNTQPPEGGWPIRLSISCSVAVSTHSRPKAAGRVKAVRAVQPLRFQHTAARRRLGKRQTGGARRSGVSTHSRPKAAGKYVPSMKTTQTFQHTAARRRLVPFPERDARYGVVSTHSRPKAAGRMEGAVCEI